MHTTPAIGLALTLTICAHSAELLQNPSTDPTKQLREYRQFAMTHEGNTAQGRELFDNEKRTACTKCHSVDGSSSKAGPDLFAIGDKFPRSELIRAVLEPSAEIAVGYGTTLVQTRSGEVLSGVVKGATADEMELVDTDGKHVRIATRDIQQQRGSVISLMPEGLQTSI